VAVPIIVGLSRMYRGMHFMSDVVAGMILGAVSIAVTLLILTPAERERRAAALPPAQRSADADFDSAPANPISASPVPGGIS
jgi:undecaprenyl-diphosphatase